MGHIDFARELDDDRHINAGASDDAFDEAVAAEARVQAVAIRANILTGHEQTLEYLAETWAARVSQSGVTETLIRAAISCGPLTAGQMLLSMIDKCIEDDAETAALAEVERKDRSGGLNMAAMRATAPADVRVPA